VAMETMETMETMGTFESIESYLSLKHRILPTSLKPSPSFEQQKLQQSHGSRRKEVERGNYFGLRACFGLLWYVLL
jgi:hypothetical protein